MPAAANAASSECDEILLGSRPIATASCLRHSVVVIRFLCTADIHIVLGHRSSGAATTVDATALLLFFFALTSGSASLKCNILASWVLPFAPAFANHIPAGGSLQPHLSLRGVGFYISVFASSTVLLNAIVIWSSCLEYVSSTVFLCFFRLECQKQLIECPFFLCESCSILCCVIRCVLRPWYFLQRSQLRTCFLYILILSWLCLFEIHLRSFTDLRGPSLRPSQVVETRDSSISENDKPRLVLKICIMPFVITFIPVMPFIIVVS